MNKICINQDSLIVHDPTPAMLPFLRRIDSSYKVNSITPNESFIPQFQHSRKVSTRVGKDDIDAITLSELKEIHSEAGTTSNSSTSPDSVSLLRIKKEIAFRQMGECELCAWNCKANRYAGKGKCGLDYKAHHARPFIHIAEEDVINPAIVVNFGGCCLDCVYCISHELKMVENLDPLSIHAFWKELYNLRNQDCPQNTLEFAGGNPTESMPWILEILSAAPEDFNLPIVWNSNLYANIESIELLDGIVDVYLPDFTFGNDDCAKRLSGIDNYWQNATKVAEAMINQNSRTIFRILVLPNHLECCHKKILEFLAQYRDKIWISIMDQYVPEHRAGHHHDINRRPSEAEVISVENLVHGFGLRDIGNHSTEFWKNDSMK